MSFKVFVRGSEHCVAALLLKRLEDMPYEVRQLGHQSGSDPAAELADDLQSKTSPSLVINFIGGHLVDDGSASLRQLAEMAELCLTRAVPILHVSSYQVFGPQSLSAQDVHEGVIPEPSDPLSIALLNFERSVALSQQHIILRLSDLLDCEEESLIGRFLPFLAGGEVALSDNVFGAPISSEFAMNTILAMAQQIFCGAQNWGVFHLHSSDSCSEAEIADQLVRCFADNCDFSARLPEIINSEEGVVFCHAANLAGRRCVNDFGVQLPSWRKGFKTLLANWLAKHPNAILNL